MVPPSPIVGANGAAGSDRDNCTIDGTTPVEELVFYSYFGGGILFEMI